jgi:alkylhydroperoxidase/carboxymuconolactone decarboxylase family protein YurZ/quercetin dioxygenase-like cupin family protein
MTVIKSFLITGLFLFCLTKDLNAQQSINKNQPLDSKQQTIVTISAFTAIGDLEQLQKALNNGLDAGLTVNEIKEVIVQLYAYTGFPRSLNALNTFIAVLKERRGKGINDQQGKEPSALLTDKSKLQFGTEMQTKLVGQPVKAEVYEFAPAIDQFLKEHLFGDIFGRDNLDWKTREIATIATLAALGNVEGQLRSHFGVGMYNGLSAEQLTHLVSIIHSKVGIKEGNAASEVLQTVLKTGDPVKKDENEKKEAIDQGLIFPKGEKITNNNFTGNAWLQQMITADNLNPTQIGNVTFEPGARTKWHLHPGGQNLLITGGIGYYQEKGSPKRIIKKGDVIKCTPGVPHWHGASKDEQLIQIAITNTQKGAVTWLEEVTDEEYNK